MRGVSQTPLPRPSMRLFTAGNLASTERDLRDVDLTPTIRRQPVCAAIPDTTMRTVFDEMYINISHLRQSMGIEVDLLSNRWLFKYLTQMLDGQMLEMIQRNPRAVPGEPDQPEFEYRDAAEQPLCGIRCGDQAQQQGVGGA